ncbi:MAG: hypothetical protein OEQ53_16195 [Saprospiraceae bacterium]|nr:hypothetical protein [Saprospiraceae bacterium]
MKYITIVVISMLALSCTGDKEGPALEANKLGTLNHQFSISDPAQDGFEKGLLLLHSFEYEDARVAFQEAVKADSTEMMAYWGEAMSYYKALWGLQDLEAGREVMNRLGATKDERLAKAENELEMDFWTGLEILNGEGELKERHEDYVEYMADLYEKHPSNHEVASFYALGLIWATDYGQVTEENKLSARIADGILKENPKHPGALHYKIHAFDNPVMAREAIDVANVYSKVAPDATHALHMPSHIYLSLGMWDDVVSSNEASYAASVKKMERKGLGDGQRGYHSYSWLHYGYLQQGRYEKATQLMRDMLDYVPRDPTNQARGYLISMQSLQLAETGKWNNQLTPMLDVKLQDLSIVSAAEHAFFQSHLALKHADPGLINQHIEDLTQKIALAELEVGEEGVALCATGQTRYAPNEDAINTSLILLHQMKSFNARLAGDLTAYERHLRKATELEAKLDFASGPPEIALPSFEQYGNWLLDQGRFEDALIQFETSLTRAPRRCKALQGKIAALKGLNKVKEVEDARVELQSIWKMADEELKGLIVGI